MAAFLVALADFDRRRGWEALGHASMFAFLRVELRLSSSAAFYRKSAARLLQRFPELVGPLGDGRLCLSSVAELAKVLTEANRNELVPRFFGRSAREARELVAEILPCEVPVTRTLVTTAVGPTASAPAVRAAQPLLTLAPGTKAGPGTVPASLLEFRRTEATAPGPGADKAPHSTYLTSDTYFGGGVSVARKGDDVEPLTADLRRLHVTVSRQFLKDLDAARDGLSHAIPGATTEQVLRAALDLLLEKQARARGLVKKPRKTPDEAPVTAQAPADPPHHRRSGPREAVPAAVRRAVWLRDGGRCSWPLDGGGICGSTHRLELDHVVPWAQGGESTVDNLRLTCAAHNRLAARLAFGDRQMSRYGGVREVPDQPRPGQ